MRSPQVFFFFFLVHFSFFNFSTQLIQGGLFKHENKSFKSSEGLIHFTRCYEKTFYITFIKTVTTPHLSLSYTAAQLRLSLSVPASVSPRLSSANEQQTIARVTHNGCYCIWQSIWGENLKQKTSFNPNYPLTSWKPLMVWFLALSPHTNSSALVRLYTVHFSFPNTMNH